MTALKVTGGARIGWVNATWPFARLAVSAGQMTVSGRVLGAYNFTPAEVIALEAHPSVPLLGSGVRILHTNPRYPEKIVFWCLERPDELIRRIRDLGFRPSALAAELPARDGTALRWGFLGMAFVLWNALLLTDFLVLAGRPGRPGPLTLLAFTLVFVGSVALDRSSRFSALVLKPGRSVSEIRAVVLLLQFVSAVLLAGVAVGHVAG